MSDDPPYNPDTNGRTMSTPRLAPKPKPFDWVRNANQNELEVYLNAVDYRAGHVNALGTQSPVIAGVEHARTQLLRFDLDYRRRLGRISSAQKHKSPSFEQSVRRGMRWHVWGHGPWYTYLGAGAHTPTDAEHQAYLARNPFIGILSGSGNTPVYSPAAAAAPAAAGPSGHVIIDLAAAGVAVQTGTPIPPKPILPPNPGLAPLAPVGNRHAIKHPFTVADLGAYAMAKPNAPIKVVLQKLYEPAGSKHNARWMQSAMDIACTLICQEQEEQGMMMHIWLTNVLEDLQWHNECRGFVLKFGNSDSAVHVLDAAYRKGIKVFAPLDGGKVPEQNVTTDEYNKYVAAKAKHAADKKAYDAIYKKLQLWNDVYGVVADTVIPSAPDKDDEDFHMLSDEEMLKAGVGKEARKRKALAEAVCIDCGDPKCSCAQLAFPAAVAREAVKVAAQAGPTIAKAEPPAVA